jgi:hypothetical protein
MPEDSEYLGNSKHQLHKFMHLSVQKEKKTIMEKGSREFGSNAKLQKPEPIPLKEIAQVAQQHKVS